jgi:hypothetical protein
MKEKTTTLGTKIFASLSVLNIIATIVCVLSVFAFRDTVLSQGSFFTVFISPAAQVFTRFLCKAISGLVWLFVLANTIISLGMMLVAMLINRSKKTYLRNAVIAS